jgi:hypothetical protein
MGISTRVKEHVSWSEPGRESASDDTDRRAGHDGKGNGTWPGRRSLSYYGTGLVCIGRLSSLAPSLEYPRHKRDLSFRGCPVRRLPQPHPCFSARRDQERK